MEGGTVRARLSGHRWIVRGLAWSPDGRLLASASGDHWTFPGEIKLWDAAGGRARYTHPAADEMGARALAWSPDGELLASAGLDGVTRLWEVGPAGDTLTLRRLLGKSPGVLRCLAFSPDGRTLAVGGDEPVLRLWQPRLGQALGTLVEPAGVHCLAFRPDGGALAVGHGDGSWRQHLGSVRMVNPVAGSAVPLDLGAEGERLLIAARVKLAHLGDAAPEVARLRVAFRRDAGRLTELAARSPGSSAFARERVSVLVALAASYPAKDAAAEEGYREATALAEQLLAGHPGDVELKEQRAQALLSRGGALLEQDRRGDAQAILGEAETAFEELAQAHSAHPRQKVFRAAHARACLRRGDALDPELRRECYRRAEDVLERLRRDHPAAGRFLEELDETLARLAATLPVDAGAEREATSRRLVAVRQQRAALHGEDATVQFALGKSLNQLGALLREPAESLAAYQRATEVLTSMKRKNLNVEGANLELIEASFWQGWIHRDQGRFLEAARWLAYLASLEAQHPHKTPEQRERDGRASADRAMAALRQAADGGQLTPDLLVKDPSLKPLRDRADFKVLLDKVQKTPKP